MREKNDCVSNSKFLSQIIGEMLVLHIGQVIFWERQIKNLIRNVIHLAYPSGNVQ